MRVFINSVRCIFTYGSFPGSHTVQKRCFMFQRLLVPAFNRYSSKEVKTVGADIAAARWLLKNGACIRWRGAKQYLHDYNAIPNSNKGLAYRIEAVDASDSCISHQGFKYLEGVLVREMKLVRCDFMENEALRQLAVYLGDSLELLEIRSLYGIDAEGLRYLVLLKNLKSLDLFDLVGVEEQGREEAIQLLKTQLPDCDIKYGITKDTDSLKDLER